MTYLTIECHILLYILTDWNLINLPSSSAEFSLGKVKSYFWIRIVPGLILWSFYLFYLFNLFWYNPFIFIHLHLP